MGRDPEAVKRKRQKEKERRQKKSDLTDEHLEFMRQKLDEHDGEENIFAKVAHKMKDEFDLDCSHDWLRGKVQSKFEEWSGIGAKRRKETAKREEVEVIDVDVAEAFEVMDHAKADLDAEKRWQKDLENLFLHKRAPPILGFVIDHQRPAEFQEIFRNEMLEYWSKKCGLPALFGVCRTNEPRGAQRAPLLCWASRLTGPHHHWRRDVNSQ